METENEKYPGKPDWFWIKIYLAVMATTIVVIGALWAFSRYFA
jgi:hypothetical protein